MGTTTSIGWAAGRWESLLHDRRTAGVLGTVEAGIAGEAVDAVIASGAYAEEDREALTDECAGAAEALGRGVYSLLYGSPDRTNDGPAWARAAAGAIAGTDGLDGTVRACQGDPDMAAIGAAAVLREVAGKIGGMIERLTEEGADPAGGDADDDASGIGVAVSGMLRGAVVKAIQEVAEARADLDGLLPGLGGTPPAHEQESDARLLLLDRIRKDDRLRRVLAIAGRMRRIAERVQRVRCDDAREEIVDVERGGDVARVLPSELQGLRAGGARRLLVLKGIADRSLVQYRLSGTEPLGKGPIVVMLDASGSMSDNLADGLRRIDWASAIGIAALRAAVEQRRDVSVCTFNGSVCRTWRVDGRDRDAVRTAVLEVATIGAGGGTNFDQPVSWALDAGAERDRADLILVTDGAGIVSEPLIARVAESRKRGLRVWGVLAGDGAIPSTLAAFCDGIASVDSSTHDPGRVIGELGAT